MEDRLIVAVSCHPILYDKNTADFKNLIKKKALWESIAMMCGMTLDKAQAKWKNLVDTYRKILKKEKEQNRGGSEPLSGKGWKYAQHMSFMVPHIMGNNSYRSPPPAHHHHHQGIITLAPPLAHHQGTIITLARPPAPQGTITLAPPPAAATQGTISTLAAQALQGNGTNLVPPPAKEASPDTTHAQPYTPETPEIQEVPDMEDTSPPEFLYEVSEEEDEEDEDDNEEDFPVPAKARRYHSHDPSLTPFQAGLLRAIEETSVPSSLPDRDPDEMFLMSLVPTVKSFSPKRKAAVKFKIHQLIYENETEALNEASSTQER